MRSDAKKFATEETPMTEDKPISIRLGYRRLTALETYLEAHPDETRNGVIAGAVEAYLKSVGFWREPPHITKGIDDPSLMASVRPTLSERVARLEAQVAALMD
jgi:hypothetical protein